MAVARISDIFACLKGGTAGAVLANRLSEVKKFQVLVIEAGPRYAQSINSLHIVCLDPRPVPVKR